MRLQNDQPKLNNDEDGDILSEIHDFKALVTQHNDLGFQKDSIVRFRRKVERLSVIAEPVRPGGSQTKSGAKTRRRSLSVVNLLDDRLDNVKHAIQLSRGVSVSKWNGNACTYSLLLHKDNQRSTCQIADAKELHFAIAIEFLRLNRGLGGHD